MSDGADRGRARLPWWPEVHDRAATREPLTRGQIVAATIRILDSEGLGAFSMRRLAQELDAGVTSLYWHVKNKDQLLDLALDEVLGEVPLDDDPTLPWQQRTAHFARLLRSVLMRHRGVSQLAGARLTLGPNALTGVDTLVGLLRSAGFEAARLGLAVSAVLDFVSGSAVMDSRALAGSDTEGLTYKELQDRSAEMLRAVPAEQYPNLASTVEDVVGPNADQRFEYALQALLDGLAVDIERARSGGSTPSGREASEASSPTSS